MEFTILKKNEFNEFSKNHKLGNFMQTIEWASLKEKYGWTPHYVGVKDEDKIIAGALLLSKKTPIGKNIFYSPRGLLIDYSNFELLSFFTKNLKRYVKKNKGIFLKIDPNIIYRVRSKNGDIIDSKTNDEPINNLRKLNYKFLGFTTYFETRQPRWTFKLLLDKSYEELKKEFEKSTRKNIEKAYKKGVKVKKGTIEDLERAFHLLDETGKRRGFINRSLSYCKNMVEFFKDNINVYIAYIDTTDYYNNMVEALKNEEKNLENIKYKMEKEIVGAKLRNQKKLAESQIKKYNSELEKAKKMMKKSKTIDIGILISVKSKDEYLSLFSGIDNNYRDFDPKYPLYDKHIIDAIKKNCKYVDFYGITGDFNKSNEYYGIYEFKKGFGGNVMELIGEFDLVINRFYYYLYKVVIFVYKKVRNIIYR